MIDGDFNFINQSRAQLGSLTIHNLSQKEAIQGIINLADEKNIHVVVTPNLDHLALFSHYEGLLSYYNQASMCLVDGWPVQLFLKMMGITIKERVTGSGIIQELCQHAYQAGQKMFFLGGPTGVGDLLSHKLKTDYPNIEVASYTPPFSAEFSKSDNQEIIRRINDFKPNLLFLALGTPKQELWVFQNKQYLPPCVVLCFGAAMEFLAGTQKRAPIWVNRMGLEWLYRLCKEPRRLFQRYIWRDIPFAIKMIFSIIFLRKVPL